MHAMYGPAGIIVLPDGSRLFAGSDRGDFEEGLPQGSPESSLAFCVLIQEAVQELHEALAGGGGGATFIMDDGYCYGRPEEVLPAIRRFADRLTDLGLHLQFRKCSFYSPRTLQGAVLRDLDALGISRGGIMGSSRGDPEREIRIIEPFLPGITVGGVPLGHEAFIRQYMSTLTAGFVSYIRSTIHQLQPASSFAMWSCLYSAIQTRLDFWLQHLTPEETEATCHAVDAELRDAVETLTYHGATASEEVRLRVRLPIWRRGCGIRSRLSLAPAAFCSSFRTACERLLDTRTADGVTRPGFFPQLAHRLGAQSFDFDTPDLRMSTLLASDSDLGHAFSDAWALLREEVDGVVDVTQSPGLLSHPAETVPAQHRMQHAITAQREAAAARRLDVLMLALPRTDPRRHAWLEAGDAAQIAGRWLASHPSERLGLVCSCSEFSEMLVSYLGVDSPAASSPGVLGASFSGYSGGRQRFVVDAGGWEVERVQMPGDGWRDAHDYIASTVFDLVSLAGITGTMEPRGIFSMAVPAEVLAAALAEDGSRRSRPGAVPDYCFTVDGRRMLYDVKRISFCPSRYWPTVAVASSRGGPLEYRASLVRAEYEAAAAALDARTAAWYVRTGTAAPVGAPTAVDILASFPPVRGLVFGSTACGGSREVGILLAQAASSSAQRQWRSLGARSMLDARSFMISTLRSQVGFAAAVAHARLRLSRLELIGGSGRTAGRYASAARAFISPTAFEQARGGALGAGGGRVGFAGGGLF
jgi:hypothetical protein